MFVTQQQTPYDCRRPPPQAAATTARKSKERNYIRIETAEAAGEGSFPTKQLVKITQDQNLRISVHCKHELRQSNRDRRWLPAIHRPTNSYRRTVSQSERLEQQLSARDSAVARRNLLRSGGNAGSLVNVGADYRS